MNPHTHSEISVRKRGGVISDYYKIHQFIDCTKNICSDNRHRILHTMWGINRIVIPIFGSVIINSDGKSIDVKDLCEQDHILPDYRNKFIPTISDFIEAIDMESLDCEDWKSQIEVFHKKHVKSNDVEELLLSPLSYTGRMASLLLTHNSWFLNIILPKIFNTKPVIDEINIAPSMIFKNMKFELWMDNGAAFSPSSKKLKWKKNM